MGITRRGALGAAAGAAMLEWGSREPAEAAPASPVAPRRGRARFRYCLNTSTIRGEKLTIEQKVDLAARAGYDALEPWISEVDDYVRAGGSLEALARRIRDRGLTVESAIAFPEWIVNDDARRARGLEEARRAMEIVRQLGGTRIAAPPAGATDRADVELIAAAERYRTLLELGDRIGVVPEVEVWGFSRTLSRLGEAAMVAMEARHPKACILADVYHLHRGGSGFEGLRLLGPGSIPVMHLNDYPAGPPRERLTDADRVFPGDGAAPLGRILQDLAAQGGTVVLSLELFNRSYWQQDPLQVARTGLEKMKAAVRRMA